jgi:hypothetical protein
MAALGPSRVFGKMLRQHQRATYGWQLNLRYCRETGAYLGVTDKASSGVGD